MSEFILVKIMALSSSYSHLRPRLQMFKHLCEQWVSLLIDTDLLEYIAPRPLQPSLLRSQTQPESVVITSNEKLKVPQLNGGLARIVAPCTEEISAGCQVQLPELSFERLDINDRVIESLSFQCGLYESQKAGKVTKYALEYLAGIIDFELSSWNFRCLRQGQQLIFQANALSSGLNLRLKSVKFPDTQLPNWSGGLRTSLSSLDPDQQAGEINLILWGPYSINGVEHQIATPLLPHFQDFAQGFLSAVKESLSAQNILARWTSDYSLQFESPPGIPLDISIPESGLLEPQLPLSFNTIQSSVPNRPETQHFKLNQQPLSFLLHSNAMAPAEILAVFHNASAQTQLEVSINTHQHLHFKALATDVAIEIQGLSPQLKSALGLDEVNFKSPGQRGQKLLEQWQALYQRLWEQLHSDETFSSLFELTHWPRELPAPHENLSLSHTSCLNYATELRQQCEIWIHHLSQLLEHKPQRDKERQLLERSRVLSPTPLSPPRQKDLSLNTEIENKRESRFDHKI